MELSSDTWISYAMKHYRNPQCVSLEEFEHDLGRFRYLKWHVNRYLKGGYLGTRHILNYLILIHNVFGIEPALTMMKYRLDKKTQWAVLKPFLISLGNISEDDFPDIESDPAVAEAIRNNQ